MIVSQSNRLISGGKTGKPARRINFVGGAANGVGDRERLIEVAHQRDVVADRLAHRAHRFQVVVRIGAAETDFCRRKPLRDQPLCLVGGGFRRHDAEPF